MIYYTCNRLTGNVSVALYANYSYRYHKNYIMTKIDFTQLLEPTSTELLEIRFFFYFGCNETQLTYKFSLCIKLHLNLYSRKKSLNILVETTSFYLGWLN